MIPKVEGAKQEISLFLKIPPLPIHLHQYQGSPVLWVHELWPSTRNPTSTQGTPPSGEPILKANPPDLVLTVMTGSGGHLMARRDQ